MDAGARDARRCGRDAWSGEGGDGTLEVTGGLPLLKRELRPLFCQRLVSPPPLFAVEPVDLWGAVIAPCATTGVCVALPFTLYCQSLAWSFVGATVDGEIFGRDGEMRRGEFEAVIAAD